MINYVKELLISKKNATGIWNLIPSHHVIEIMASAGLNFQILDMEHGPYNFNNILLAIQTMAGFKCSPIVRIPYIEQTLIQRLLDCGSHGILAPQIHTKTDVENLINFSTYPPEGIRGYNPFTRSGSYLGDSESIFNKKNFAIIIGIIENLDAVENIDQILEVQGVDVWYLGIYDMSCSLGLKGNLNHPKVQEVYQYCEKKIRDYGKIPGRMVDNFHEIPENNNEFLVLKPDTFQLKTAIQSKL